MGRITSFSKQVIVFVIALTLIIRPAFASTVGGWTMSNPIAQGASTVYTGTKNVIINGVDYIKTGTAKITPTASAVSKVLARGVAGVALSVAVEQLLGAVDWVLDPANNQITYKVPSNDPANPASKGRYCFNVGIGGGLPARTVCSTQPSDVCNAIAKSNGQTSYPLTQIGTTAYGPTYRCGSSWTLVAQANPAYDPQATEEKRSIPLDVVSAKVISNAESDTDKKAAAQVATTAAAADIVAEADTDETKARPIVDQLNKSASTKPADSDAAANAGTGTATATPKADPATGEAAPPTDIVLKFPIFCDWAPTICEAAQTVISFPTTLTEWWTTGKEKAESWALSISQAWTKVKEEYADKPEEITDTELDLPDQSPPDINTDISFGGSCPASRSVPVSFAGIHTEIEFSFQWFCEIASIAKPVIISISAFASTLIIAGVRTEDD